MEEASISLPSISLKALPVWFKISMGILHLSDGLLWRYYSMGAISWWLDPCRKNQDRSDGCKPSTLVHLNEEMVASRQVKWQQIKSSCTRQYDNSTNKLGTRLECSQLSFQDHWRWKVTYTHRYIPLVPRSTHRLLISLRICSMDCTPDGWDCEEIYGEKEWMFLAHILLYPSSSEL